MTDLSPTKTKALELSIHVHGTPQEVVARAAVYHAFLTGSAAAAAAAPAASAASAGGKPAAVKPDAAAGGKPAGGKPTAGKPDAAPKTEASKADAPKTEAPKPAPKATAAKAGASAQQVPADTKAPGGKNTYADVVEALRKVKDKTTKEDALAILKEDGGNAASVRDLKPALYDAVVEGCENALSGEGEDESGAGGEAGFEDPTAQPDRDELGL